MRVMRLEALQKNLKKKQFSGYLITNLNNIYYFTGFQDVPGATLALLVSMDDPSILLTPPLSYVAAQEQAENCVVQQYPERGKYESKIKRIVQDWKAKVIGFDDLSISHYLNLTQILKPIRFIPDQDIIWELRRIKNKKEIELMKRAAELTDLGANVGMEAIEVGIREYEVAAEIEYAMRQRGSEGTAFETVVASGPRSAYPHGVSTDRILKKGDFIVLDLGARYKGYRCDITRTVVVGKPTSNQTRILGLLMEAQEEAFQAIREGVKARTVDMVARKIIETEGFGKQFIHGLGHGVGLDIHEPPYLSSKSVDVLERGNVVTDEPGIYLQMGGARIEDTVLVHKTEGERLTKAHYFEW
jgi:Xaa-Pro aminopeptidase